MIRIGIKRLHLKSGDMLDLPSQGIVAIVGPNNAGKTVFLQETYNSLRIQNLSDPVRWVSAVELMKDGDIRAYFEEHARIPPDANRERGATKALFPAGSRTTNPRGYNVAHLEMLWHSDPITPFQDAADHFSQFLAAMDRGRLLDDTETREPGISPTHPLHFVEDSRDLQAKLSSLINTAFGFPVSINRYSRRMLSLLRGEPDIPDTTPPPSEDLIDQYNALPPVRNEGDGVRSFVGLLITALSGGPYVTLIDEPEAYLHPPQAKLLGQYLAEQPETGGQLIVATHSSDFLEGLLDGAGDREVAVLRLSIDLQSATHDRAVHALPPARVSTLWSDPLMRYSRMLDGLFHNGMVICEADNDCRFYSAAIDQYLSRKVAHDLVLTHVGGKGRLSKALDRVRPLHIRAAVITDVDILDNKETLQSLVEAAQGDFARIDADLATVTNAVLNDNTPPTVRRLKTATSTILNNNPLDNALTQHEIETVRESVRLRSGWKKLKRAGLPLLTGKEYNAAQRIISYLSTIGVFVVPVGELERWYPDIEAGHGEHYVTTVLENARLEQMPPVLVNFLASLTAYFGVALSEEVI